MLPQTNLQLYRLMMDRGADEASLAHVREAYDVARRLFVGCHRPNHKPFLCHLVGVAGALAEWGQKSDVVAAGLLHSAHMFGDFGDGSHGATPAKRRILRQRLGATTELLIDHYGKTDWDTPLADVVARMKSGACSRTVVLLKLADLCDECVDGGPNYSPVKPLEFGLPWDVGSRCAVLELLASIAGDEARDHMAGVFALVDAISPPTALATDDRSYHVVAPGIDEMRRSRIRLRLRRIAHGFTGKKAA